MCMAGEMLLTRFRALLSLWLALLPESLPMLPHRSYSSLYGNVVGLAVANVSQGMHTTTEDVSNAVQVVHARLEAVFSANQLSNFNISVEHITKTRLLYSEDGDLPTLFAKRVSQDGRQSFQRTQIVLGLLYTFTVVVNHPSSDSSSHLFTVTRDPHKQYHINRHTSLPFHDLNKNSPTGSKDYTTDGDTCEEGTTLKRRNVCTANTDRESQSCELPVPDSWTQPISSNPPEPLCSEESQGSNSLRVATYNIWNVDAEANDSYKHRLRRLGKFIASRDADVFAFQEVRLQVGKRPKKTMAQVSHLSHHLPEYQFVYQPAMLFPSSAVEGGRTEEGVAIFSKHPIVASDYILLYRNETDEQDRHQRVCLHAAIDVPHTGLVHVFVTHLSLAEEAQIKCVVEIWQYMERFTGPKFLMGDLNAEPHSTPIRFLNGEVSLEGVWCPRLYDLWAATHTAADRQTGYTFSAVSSLVKRIDYIFMQADVVACDLVRSALCVASTTIEGTAQPCSDAACSDHLALVSTLHTSG